MVTEVQTPAVDVDGNTVKARVQMAADQVTELLSWGDLIRPEARENPINYSIVWPDDSYDPRDYGVEIPSAVEFEFSADVSAVEVVLEATGVETVEDIADGEACIGIYTPSGMDNHHYTATIKVENGVLFNRAPESARLADAMFGSRQEAGLLSAVETALLWGADSNVPVYIGPNLTLDRAAGGQTA